MTLTLKALVLERNWFCRKTGLAGNWFDNATGQQGN